MWKRIRTLLWVALGALVMRSCVMEPVRLTDESMMPTFGEGNVGLVCKICYGLRVPGAGSVLLEWRPPQRGDLVVAAAVGDPPSILLRRVTGMPGDQVRLDDGTPLELKAGEYFLSAERKEGTLDSRKFGPVPRRAIVGLVSHRWIAKTPSKEGGSQVVSPEPFWRMIRRVL